MKNNIRLLPLQLKDCEAVFKIAKVSLPEHWSLQSVKDVLNYDNNIYYVAKCEDEVVGFAGIMVVADEAELLNIAVEEEARGQGVGQLLLNAVINASEEKNAIRLLLEVRKSNENALRLYKKNDFSVIGQRKAYYSNPTEDAVIMERKSGML